MTKFIKLPFRLHEGTVWVPPLVAERRQFLDRDQEPVLRARRGRVLPRLARRRGGGPHLGSDRRALGPVPGRQRRDVRLLRMRERPRGGEGAVRRRRRMAARRAAASASSARWTSRTNDECGLLIEGYDLAPLILQPWHPPYYAELIEGEGMTKSMDLLMWWLELGEQMYTDEGFHPMIHELAKKVEGRARGHDPRLPQEGPRGRDHPLHRGLQLGLGEELGLRPDHRGGGPRPGLRPEAGARRALGLHRRARRRDARRGADAARRQPGPRAR